MATTGIDCDDELFASLLSAKADEVDMLVDIITDFSRGRAGLDADIRSGWYKPSTAPDLPATKNSSSSCWDTNCSNSAGTLR